MFVNIVEANETIVYNIQNTTDINEFIKKYSVESGVGINKNSIYLLCVINNKLEYMKFIKKNYGTYLGVRNGDNDDALLLACYHGHLDIVKYLIEDLSWDCRTKDKYDNNIYLAAAMKGNLEVMEYLESIMYIDIYAINKGGFNVVYYAVSRNYLRVIKYLHKKHSYNFMISTKNGQMPREIAYHYGNKDIVDYFDTIKDPSLLVKNRLKMFDDKQTKICSMLSVINETMNKCMKESSELNFQLVGLVKEKNDFKKKLLSSFKNI